MYSNICGAKVSFTLPEPDNGKVTLKNWLDGIDHDRIGVSILDTDGTIIAKLDPAWTGTGWKASPVQFQHGEQVFTSWANIQPDRFGVDGRIGYTVCVKYLYTRKTVTVEA